MFLFLNDECLMNILTKNDQTMMNYDLSIFSISYFIFLIVLLFLCKIFNSLFYFKEINVLYPHRKPYFINSHNDTTVENECLCKNVEMLCKKSFLKGT